MGSRRISSLLLIPSLIAGLAVVAPGAAAARKRPDLVVTAVSTSETLVPTGARVRITETVKNRGRAIATASVTAYFLSKDGVAGGDIRMPGIRKVTSLRPRRASKGGARIMIPRSVAPGDYRVVVCADAKKQVAESNERNNCRVSGTLAIRAATDHDLIDQARAAGEIDAETAVIYEVFADFGDPRLPARFNGDDSQVFESDLLTTVARDWSTYSPQTQATLAPFLIPPFHHGSWADDGAGGTRRLPRSFDAFDDYEIRCRGAAPDELPNLTRWGYFDAASGAVRIWYLKDNQLSDESLALTMAAEIDDHIWPELISKMGFSAPLGDDGSSKTCRGGTDAYDISLVDIPRANTYAPIACDNTWVGTLFNRNENPADIPEILAHEIFHAIQFRYDVENGCLKTGGEYGWWKEASAQWVEDALYSDDREHHFAPRMLKQPWLSLDDPGSWPGEDRFYGEYLVPFFLARTGRAATVKQIWDNTTGKGMSDALKAPFGSDFDKVWKDFTLHNLNRGDFNKYETWDGLTSKAELTADLLLAEGDQQMSVSLDPLAAKYFRITPKSGLTNLRFRNNSVDVDGVGIQAVVEYGDGSWKDKDWSDEELVELCLRDPTVKAIWVIFSNSNSDISIPPVSVEWTGEKGTCCSGREGSSREGSSPKASAPLLPRAAADGCLINGTSSGTTTQQAGPVHRWNASYVLEATAQGAGFVYYTVRSGSVSWSLEGYWGTPGCRITPTSRTFQMEPYDAELDLRDTDSDGDFDNYVHSITVTAEVETTMTCEDGGGVAGEPIPFLFGPMIAVWSDPLAWNGTFPIKGSRTYNVVDEISWQWDLDR